MILTITLAIVSPTVFDHNNLKSLVEHTIDVYIVSLMKQPPLKSFIPKILHK